MSTLLSPSKIKVCQCGHLIPKSRVWQITSPPHLNLTSLIHPSFFRLKAPLPNPGCLCPILCGQGGELLFFLQTKCFHEQRQRSRTIFPAAAAICLLNCNVSVRAKPYRMRSPRPCWHHTRSQQLLDTHLHVALLESFILLDKRESHFALLSSRLFFRSQVLDFGSQVDSKRFHCLSSLLRVPCCIDAPLLPRNHTTRSSCSFLPFSFQ